MESVHLRINGLPMPKGSVVKMGKQYLPAGTAASRMNMELWKENIASIARVEMGERKPWGRAIRMIAEFNLPAPKTTIKSHQKGWWPHVKRPDVDKLARALLDPLTGIVWVDDSQVCFLSVNKTYAWDEKPGASVFIDFLTDEWCQTYGEAKQKITHIIGQL